MDKHKLPETWFCFTCVAGKSVMRGSSKGTWAPLKGGLRRKNPVSYRLPAGVRDHFEFVATGDEGEYVEHFPSKHK